MQPGARCNGKLDRRRTRTASVLLVRTARGLFTRYGTFHAELASSALRGCGVMQSIVATKVEERAERTMTLLAVGTGRTDNVTRPVPGVSSEQCWVASTTG